jgi:hypothetical protein
MASQRLETWQSLLGLLQIVCPSLDAFAGNCDEIKKCVTSVFGRMTTSIFKVHDFFNFPCI